MFGEYKKYYHQPTLDEISKDSKELYNKVIKIIESKGYNKEQFIFTPTFTNIVDSFNVDDVGLIATLSVRTDKKNIGGK